MNYTHEQILEIYGFPKEGIVAFEGKWYVPDGLRKPKVGDFVWNDSKAVFKIDSNEPFVWLTLREQPVPPIPTPEQLKDITPLGKVAKLLPVPSQMGDTFVSSCRNVIITTGCGNRTTWVDLFKGFRWLVELTDEVVEKPAEKPEVTPMKYGFDRLPMLDSSAVATTEWIIERINETRIVVNSLASELADAINEMRGK